MSLPLDKSSIRITFLNQRLLLSRAEVGAMSGEAQDQFLSLPTFQRATTLALYSPIRNEVETDKLLSVALAMGKQVYYPAASEEGMRFFRVRSLADLQVGRFGILEPVRGLTEIASAQLELLLVPGVAFDRQGHRLGYGRGYFDRFLNDGCFTGLSVGFGYDFQVLDKLPTDEHDQRVALLVTDREIYSPLQN